MVRDGRSRLRLLRPVSPRCRCCESMIVGGDCSGSSNRPVTDADAAVAAAAVDRAAIVVAVVIPDDTDPTLPEIAAVPAVVGLVVVLLLLMSYLLQRI